jgi:hypothetical protein
MDKMLGESFFDNKGTCGLRSSLMRMCSLADAEKKKEAFRTMEEKNDQERRQIKEHIVMKDKAFHDLKARYQKRKEDVARLEEVGV